jgi:hypothetical protein
MMVEELIPALTSESEVGHIWRRWHMPIILALRDWGYAVRPCFKQQQK